LIPLRDEIPAIKFEGHRDSPIGDFAHRRAAGENQENVPRLTGIDPLLGL
jgi:hypothetical protein